MTSGVVNGGVVAAVASDVSADCRKNTLCDDSFPLNGQLLNIYYVGQRCREQSQIVGVLTGKVNLLKNPLFFDLEPPSPV